jgi:hypothetical protein
MVVPITAAVTYLLLGMDEWRELTCMHASMVEWLCGLKGWGALDGGAHHRCCLLPAARHR